MPEKKNSNIVWVLVAITFVLAVFALVGFALWVTVSPTSGSRENALLNAVSIQPQKAAVEGAQWRLVSQWQDPGGSDPSRFYLVEFKPIPGWEAPAPMVLKHGDVNAKIEGVYQPVEFRTQNIMTLSGAIVIAHRLAPELAANYLKNIGAEEVRIVPGRQAGLTTVEGIFYGTKEVKTITIVGAGTPSGYADLQDKISDVAMAMEARQPGLRNINAPDGGSTVGTEALAFIVNPMNPVKKKGLSLDQVQQIFQGQVTDWSQVSEGSGPIKVFILTREFGARRFLEKALFSHTSFLSTATEMDDHLEMPSVVAQDPLAIGFCTLGFVGQAAEVPLRLPGESEAVLPNRENVQNGHYPLVRDLVLHLPERSRNIYARDFIRSAKSPAGQSLVRRNGFVELMNGRAPETTNILQLLNAPGAEFGRSATGLEAPGNSFVEKNATAGELSKALPELVQIDGESVSEELRRSVYNPYIEAVHGAQHLPYVFHFELSSSRPDKQAVADVKEVQEFLKRPENKGKQLVLVGFADSVGDYSANLRISKDRAEIIARLFQEKGIQNIQAIGAGEESPRESNEKRAGRQKNRRVEIWVK